MTRLARAAALTLTALAVSAAWADADVSPRWQARLQLNSSDNAAEPSAHFGGTRVLSANLLGDYYLTRSGVSGVNGGLRATGGVLLGPLSMAQSSGGLALGSGLVAAGRRNLMSTRLDAYTLEPSSNLSYLGIGYTGRVRGSGLAFSADFGLMSGTYGGLRLGRSNDRAFEEAMLRFKPLLQLGLAYSY